MAGGVLLPTGQVPLAGRQAHSRRPAFQADDLRSSRSVVSCRVSFRRLGPVCMSHRLLHVAARPNFGSILWLFTGTNFHSPAGSAGQAAAEADMQPIQGRAGCTAGEPRPQSVATDGCKSCQLDTSIKSVRRALDAALQFHHEPFPDTRRVLATAMQRSQHACSNTRDRLLFCP